MEINEYMVNPDDANATIINTQEMNMDELIEYYLKYRVY